MKSQDTHTVPWTLEQLLPHRAPMLLLDKILHCEQDRVDTQVNVHSRCSFFDKELRGVPVWVGIEYMAQTIGVWEGYRKIIAGEKIQSAFLLGVRDFRIEGTGSVFPEGSQLRVSIAPVLYDEEKRLGVFDSSIFSAGIQCQARVNAFSPLEPQNFIEALRKDESIV